MKEISLLIPSIYKKFEELYKSEKFSLSIPGIGANDLYYLDILYSLGSPRFSDFAEKAEITRPAASQIIKKLLSKGYVEKTQCNKDKRIYYIKVKPVIERHFQESEAYLSQIYQSCLSHLSEDEKVNLKKILYKIDHSLYQLNQSQ